MPSKNFLPHKAKLDAYGFPTRSVGKKILDV